MALDQNAQYPVGTAGPSAAYPEGEAVNETALDALDGYPWEKEGINDLLGFQQALLLASGQAASGSADTALVSQYLRSIVELASGRAFTYDDTGVADAYIATVQAGQQGPVSLFDGMIVDMLVGNTNTGASTINVNGLGIKNIVGAGSSIAGKLAAGERIKLRYQLSSDDYVLIDESVIFTETYLSAEQNLTVAGSLILAHGLLVVPTLIQIKIICKVAEGNYSVGDAVIINPAGNDPGATAARGISIVPDNTNINIRFGGNVNIFSIMNKTTGAGFPITPTSWRLIVRGWR